MTPTTFNMKDLSNSVAEEFNMTAKLGAEVTKFVFEQIKQQVASGSQVRLHQFGTLETRVRAAGLARNPKTGVQFEVPPRRVLKLTVSDALKELIS